MSCALKKVGEGEWIDISKVYGLSIKVRYLNNGGDYKQIANYHIIDTYNKTIIPVKNKAAVKLGRAARYGFNYTRLIIHILPGSDPQFTTLEHFHDDEVED
jgi:hypothetical protein